MRYTITGVHRELSARERNLVRLVIASLPDLTEMTTGAAHGVDTEAFLAGIECFPHARHRIVIPAAPHNEWLDTMKQQAIIEHAGAGISHSDSYMNRNEKMIRYADKLIAFPETDSEELRSGTWATVRRARKAGIGVEIRPLNGKSPEDGHGIHLKGRTAGRRRPSGGR